MGDLVRILPHHWHAAGEFVWLCRKRGFVINQHLQHQQTAPLAAAMWRANAPKVRPAPICYCYTDAVKLTNSPELISQYHCHSVTVTVTLITHPTLPATRECLVDYPG